MCDASVELLRLAFGLLLATATLPENALKLAADVEGLGQMCQSLFGDGAQRDLSLLQAAGRALIHLFGDIDYAFWAVLSLKPDPGALVAALLLVGRVLERMRNGDDVLCCRLSRFSYVVPGPLPALGARRSTCGRCGRRFDWEGEPLAAATSAALCPQCPETICSACTKCINPESIQTAVVDVGLAFDAYLEHHRPANAPSSSSTGSRGIPLKFAMCTRCSVRDRQNHPLSLASESTTAPLLRSSLTNADSCPLPRYKFSPSTSSQHGGAVSARETALITVLLAISSSSDVVSSADGFVSSTIWDFMV